MTWEVFRVDEVVEWEASLPEKDFRKLVKAYLALESSGPRLGRPFADRIKGSALHNLKELRFSGVTGAAYRLLFVFDTSRKAVVLVAGDKKGEWTKWYQKQIPLAEQRYLRYLKNLR